MDDPVTNSQAGSPVSRSSASMDPSVVPRKMRLPTITGEESMRDPAASYLMQNGDELVLWRFVLRLQYGEQSSLKILHLKQHAWLLVKSFLGVVLDLNKPFF